MNRRALPTNHISPLSFSIPHPSFPPNPLIPGAVQVRVRHPGGVRHLRLHLLPRAGDLGAAEGQGEEGPPPDFVCGGEEGAEEEEAAPGVRGRIGGRCAHSDGAAAAAARHAARVPRRRAALKGQRVREGIPGT